MEKKNSFLKDTLEVVISVGITVFILLKFVLIPCIVDGTSMFPTLKNNDFGYSFVFTKNLGIERFDIVVIRLKTENKKLLVKRVIGMPGDTVEYKDNVLYINGQVYEEVFLNDDVYTDDYAITVGEDEYFCLGDNRSVSRDSRYYGPFTSDMIVSSHFFAFFPFERFGYKN